MKKQTEYWLNSAGDDLMLIQEIIENEHLTNSQCKESYLTADALHEIERIKS